jgi:hypothetical protein
VMMCEVLVVIKGKIFYAIPTSYKKMDQT